MAFTPAAIGGRTQSDALPALICYVVVLVGIPSALIVKPLGAAGTPAQIIAICLLGWWLASRIISRQPPQRSNPVKWLMLIFIVAILSSYAAGMTRPISYSVEVSSSDRSLLSLCAWSGVVLVMIDGITTRRRLDTLLRVLAGGVTVIAILGIIQFAFKVDLAHIIKYPGLTQNTLYGQLVGRSKYDRVSGTTNHPIEFGVVLSAALPLLFHFARSSETRDQRRRWWFAVALVSVALPMSVARSGMLGGFIAIVYLFYTWPGWLRLRVAIIGILGALSMSVVVPGLLGTIRGLFVNASSDPSTLGRTADYAPVIHYFDQHPIFGRGIGTFIPSLYRTLDNAYLGLLVEAGLFGMLALIVLFFGTGFVASSVRRNTKSESTRDLAQCLKAAIAVVGINAATFDALGFAMCAGMIFLYVGATGALWSIETQARAETRPPLRRPLSQRAWVRLMAIAGALILVVFATGGLRVKAAKPAYLDYGALIANPPSVQGDPAYATTSSTSITVSILRDIMRSQPTRAKLAAEGATDYEVALQNGSIEPGTDVEGDSGPVLYVETRADTPEQAARSFALVYQEASSRLAGEQNQVGIRGAGAIRVGILQQTPAFPIKGRPTRARAVFVLLFAVLAAAYYHLVRRRRLLVAGMAASPTTPFPEPETLVGMR